MAKGFLVPNHTQTPNSLFDTALAEIKSYAELKVILAIIRFTFGWHKLKDKVSLSQIQKMTGLSRQGAQNGIELALEHEYIEREPDGQAFIYGLKLVNEVDQSTNLTSPRARQKPVKQVDQKLVNQVDTPKKGKEILTKESKPSAHAELMDFLSTKIGHIPNGGQQGKSVKWLLERYDPVECFGCFNFLAAQDWRSTPVTWATVQSNIGAWLAKRPMATPALNGYKSPPLPTGVRQWKCGCGFSVLQNGNGITQCPECSGELV